jgi:hypothetical protein
MAIPSLASIDTSAAAAQHLKRRGSQISNGEEAAGEDGKEEEGMPGAGDEPSFVQEVGKQ